MINVFAAIKEYSQRDLNSGQASQGSFFYHTKNFKPEENFVKLGSNITLLKEKGLLQIGELQVPIKNVYKTDYDENGTLHIEKQDINPKGSLNVIHMVDDHWVLVLDDAILNSTYIQLMVFENYDHTLFEPVVMNPFVKIYKLKI